MRCINGRKKVIFVVSVKKDFYEVSIRLSRNTYRNGNLTDYQLIDYYRRWQYPTTHGHENKQEKFIDEDEATERLHSLVVKDKLDIE